MRRISSSCINRLALFLTSRWPRTLFKHSLLTANTSLLKMWRTDGTLLKRQGNLALQNSSSKMEKMTNYDSKESKLAAMRLYQAVKMAKIAITGASSPSSTSGLTLEEVDQGVSLSRFQETHHVRGPTSNFSSWPFTRQSLPWRIKGQTRFFAGSSPSAEKERLALSR